MARRGPCCLQPHPKEVGADGRAPRPDPPLQDIKHDVPFDPLDISSRRRCSRLSSHPLSLPRPPSALAGRGFRLRVGQTYRWRGSLGYTLSSSLQGSLLLPGGRASARVASRRRTHSSPVRAESEGRRRFTAESAPGTVRSVSREAAAAELGCQRAPRCCARSGS